MSMIDLLSFRRELKLFVYWRLSFKAAVFSVFMGMTQTVFGAVVEIDLPSERAFPEALTSTRDGTIFVGSFAEGGITRVAPGQSKAEPWIKPGENNSRSIFGVLADEASNTLLACSNDASGFGVPGPGSAKGSALKSFDLTTGQAKGSTPLPGAPTLCNDMAIGPDGAIYVTDSFNPHVLRLKPGASSFEVWASNPQFTPPKGGAGLDGIAFDTDGSVYVSMFTQGQLFKIAVTEGNAGEVTLLQTSRKIVLPDSLRRYGPKTFLLVEGAGSLDLVTIDGQTAKIETIKDGLDGPVSVTRIGNDAWVAQGQLGHLLNPNLKNEPPKLPFRLLAVPLTP